MTADPLRILIVDDHALAREGLKAVLTSSGFSVVGEAADGPAAIALTEALCPDVVLMDVRLKGDMDGLEATRRIAALGLSARVLMLTLHDLPAYVREALAAGAAGYVLKDTAIDDLQAAIVRVAQGQTALPLDLVSAAMRAPEPVERDPAALSSLTGRERQVLDLIVDGASNKVIASTLAISPRTVEIYRARLMRKYNASTAADLVHKLLAGQ